MKLARVLCFTLQCCLHPQDACWQKSQQLTAFPSETRFWHTQACMPLSLFLLRHYNLR